MIEWWLLAVLVVGANFALWGSVGLCRLSGQAVRRLRLCWRARGGPLRGAARMAAAALAAGVGAAASWRLSGVARAPAPLAAAGAPRPPGRPPARPRPLQRPVHPPAHPRPPSPPLTVNDVAVLIPAHNEALVIGDSLKAIMALAPRRNVYVVSDGSTDDTAAIARAAGAKVIETRANVGKAGALQEAIARFRLVKRYRLLMLLDADTRVQPGYFEAALPMFGESGVVAVAGCVRTASGRTLSPVGHLLVNHRRRIYAIGQRVLKFGQTWLRMNATHIVPGFASVYRTQVLPQIEMNPPGLVIEDYNMTFEVYQKGLGKVAFTLAAVAMTQDPDNFHDYVRQTRRWALGLWQTVRRHPPRANLFTVMLVLLLLELVSSSLLFLLLPLVLLVLVVPDLIADAAAWPVLSPLHALVSAHMTLTAVLIGVLVPDLALTVAAAAAERKPAMLLFAPFFPVMRLVDAAIGLSAIPLAWLSGSSGRWQSPARRPLPVRETGQVPAFAGEGPHASG